MSGPVSTDDAPALPAHDDPHPCDVEVIEGREAEVGGFAVRRVLPRRPRRAVGAWCFADHMGPGTVTAEQGLDVGPHPHIGLHTVTWLLEGQLLHRDSLGSEQLIRPGQLNLMTAGAGVSHSEETDGVHEGVLHGIQLWVAQPEEARHGPPAFEHHPELPFVDLGSGLATVLVGRLAGVESPARRDTDLVGVDLDLRAGSASLPLDAGHEHAIVVVSGRLRVRGTALEPGRLAYLGTGLDEVELDVAEPARALLLGGEPFPEDLLMWWNYVARTRDEVTEAHRAWSAGDERFGKVASPVSRIDVPGPPWA